MKRRRLKKKRRTKGKEIGESGKRGKIGERKHGQSQF